MNSLSYPRDQIQSKIGRTACDQDSLLQILEYRAREIDNEITNQLLKELVLNYSDAQRELVALNEKLTEKQRRLDEDLEVAAGIQRTLLPGNLPSIENVEFSWKFLPCELIGGDIFNVFALDEDHLGLYMIDVSGHGVPAALVTVSISQMLQPNSEYVKKSNGLGHNLHEIVSPKDVLNILEDEYPIERFDMFFSIIYAVINCRNGNLAYSRGGHPPAIILHSDGSIELLDKGGPIIGIGALAPFEEGHNGLRKGDKVIYYTDGITEYENESGELYGKDRLHALLKNMGEEPIAIILDEVMKSVVSFGGAAMPQDDVSLLGMEFKGIR